MHRGESELIRLVLKEKSALLNKYETNMFQSNDTWLSLLTALKQCIMGSVSSTSIMDFHKPPTVQSFLSVTTLCFLTNLVSIWRLLSPCWFTYIIAWYMLIYYNETSCVRGECIIHEGPFWSRDDDRWITLGIDTQYNYKQSDLTNFYAEVVI